MTDILVHLLAQKSFRLEVPQTYKTTIIIGQLSPIPVQPSHTLPVQVRGTEIAEVIQVQCDTVAVHTPKEVKN